MKRSIGLFLCAAVTAAALAAALPVRPARAARPGQPPRLVPNFVEPVLFEGFEPLEVDEFGLSPKGEFLVYEDVFGLHVIRTEDGVEVFQDTILDNFQVLFTPSEGRFFLLERSGSGYRLRFIELEKKDQVGLVLFDEHFLDRPEIRTDLDGLVNLVAVPMRNQTRILVFDAKGRVFFQRAFTELVRWGINLHHPLVAFVDPIRNGDVQVLVVNARAGLPTFQSTAHFPYELGFEPGGPDFVLGSAGGLNVFRVVLVQGKTGTPLLNRSFSGPLNVGFTPDSQLLGVRSRIGSTQRIYLFRTTDGTLVPAF